MLPLQLLQRQTAVIWCVQNSFFSEQFPTELGTDHASRKMLKSKYPESQSLGSLC